MKTYVKPEVSIENLFSATTVAYDPFDYNGDYGTDVETELSAGDNGWWDDLLG